MPILHQMHMSGNCYKVRLCARQTGVALTLKDYGLHDGTTRGPEFLSLNPNGRVPLVEFEDGRLLAESGAILFFFSDGTALQPNNAWDRAQMLQWMFFEQYSHEPYIAVARYWLHFASPEARAKKQHLIGEWHEKGRAALGVMECHLARHDYFAGNSYSIADIALYAYTHSAADGGFDLSEYPAVCRWLSRVAAQPNHVLLDTRW